MKSVTFFNYELGYVLAKGVAKHIITYFNKLPPDEKAVDFIIHKDRLLKSRASYLHKAQYLGLCSLRNYDDYINSGIIHLDRKLIPPYIQIADLEENPLIKITDEYIYLLLEEN